MGNNGNADYRIERFGPFEVHQRLGIGGMATVHLAMERGVEGFERWVALKRLLPHLSDDDEFVRSFVREAQLASRLNHACIVQINQLGKVGEDYFISMEYIEGRDVRAVLRQARKVAGPPPLTVIASLLAELLDALDYAHRKTDDNDRPLGLVHRDISPSNLLVSTTGHLKIIDFGIAKATTQQSRTQTGKIKGKLAYISPEVLRGKAPDARSDLFSVGIIAHELLTARPLFASKNDYKTIQRIQNAEVLPPSSLNTSCPPELDQLVLRALAKQRVDRWSSAREMLEALSQITQAFHLHATARDVAGWMEWAFSLPIPGRGEPSEETQRLRGHAPRAPTLAEGEEELLDIIWGSHGGPRAPLKLDEVAALAAETRDEEESLDTDPSSAAPTALLFAVGPNLGHSDMSIDEGWNKAVTIADADRIGAVIESDFESTEPAGLVGVGDSQAFGTIDLSKQEWSDDVPLAKDSGPESALFSERELKALSEPLGGGVTVPLGPAPRPKIESSATAGRPALPAPIDAVAPPSKESEPRAPFAKPPRNMRALADLSPPTGNFDDTEPTGASIALPAPVAPALRPRPLPSLFDGPRPLAKRSTLPNPPVVVAVPVASSVPAPTPHAVSSQVRAPTPRPGVASSSAVTTIEAEPPPPAPAAVKAPDPIAGKRTTAGGTGAQKAPADPIDVVLLIPKKTKKRVTAVTAVPPLPQPEEPSVSVTGQEIEALKAERPTIMADDKPERPAASAPASAPASPDPSPAAERPTIMAPPVTRDPSSPALELSSPTIALDPGSGPMLVPLRAIEPPELIAAPPPLKSNPIVPILIALAFLSLVGSIAAYLLTRPGAEPTAPDGSVGAIGSSTADAGSVAPDIVVDAGTPVLVAAPDAGAAAATDAAPSGDRPARKAGVAAEVTAVPGEVVPASVRARVCIDRRGRVQSARVLDSVSDAVRSEVIEAVSQWLYHPYRRDDKPVKACFEEPVPVVAR